MRQFAGLSLWTVILACAGLPLAWLVASVVVNPVAAIGHAGPGAYHLEVFARTLLLAAAGATGATLLAVVPAAALGKSRWAGVLLWPLMAALVAMPQPAWAYGWAEAVRQWVGLPAPASWLDYARVAITNATAWWPIPAAAMALAWRRLPRSILDAAEMDGARGRMTARLLVGPALAGWSAALLLSAQNLSPADQSGIVVASVVVRDTFQGVSTPQGGAALSPGEGASAVVLDSQPERMAAAIMVGMPSFLATAGLAALGWTVLRRSVAWGEEEEIEATKVFASAGRTSALLAPSLTLFRRERGRRSALALSLVSVALVTAAVLPPVVALVRTNDGIDLVAAYRAHEQALRIGLRLSLLAAVVCAALAIAATVMRARVAMMFSIACFLLGGQFVALGLIRAFLVPGDWPEVLGEALARLYSSDAVHVAAYVALFAWLPLGFAATTWGARWRSLRDQAAADGATPAQATAYVVWPLAWPGVLASSAAVLALALTESQATALLVPGTPINFMLSNLHTLNYAAMAEAALLMMLVCAAGTMIGVLAWLAVTHLRCRAGERRGVGGQSAGAARRVGRDRAARRVMLAMLMPVLAMQAVSCDESASPPLAVWAESGAGPGQLAYPRAITYSPADDTVWVVDKTARVQQFNSDGNYVGGWTMPEQKYGKPVGISVDPEGNVWVPDTHYYRVIVYRPDGTEWFRFGEQGVGPGQFIWPTDVLVLDDGRVLVSEYGSGGGEMPSNDRIQIFQRSPDGTIMDAPRQVIGQIGSFGMGPGQFRRPQSLAMRGDVLWVTDGTNHRLLAFSLDGELLETFGGRAGSAPGEFRFPYGLEVDNDGNLLVAEFGNHRVQKIDPDTGECLAAWGGSFGSRPGQVKYPWGLAYDSARNRVIVLDSGNDRMQVVELKPIAAASSGSQQLPQDENGRAVNDDEVEPQ